jgi:hypothetical protein
MSGDAVVFLWVGWMAFGLGVFLLFAFFRGRVVGAAATDGDVFFIVMAATLTLAGVIILTGTYSVAALQS